MQILGEDVSPFGSKSSEGFRKKIHKGIPKYQIPQLEPYFVNNFEKTLTNDFGR